MGWVSKVGRDPGRERTVVNTKETTKSSDNEKQDRPRHRVRLPGFLIEEEIGLGDAVKRVTYAMGMKPCGGCEKRAAALNKWMHFTM
jgi:hypothetical protein